MELIHKFFDLAKLESGDKAIEMTKVNMNEVCREKILSFYDLVTTKGFQVHIDIAEKKYICTWKCRSIRQSIE